MSRRTARSGSRATFCATSGSEKMAMLATPSFTDERAGIWISECPVMLTLRVAQGRISARSDYRNGRGCSLGSGRHGQPIAEPHKASVERLVALQRHRGHGWPRLAVDVEQARRASRSVDVR